MRNLQYPILLDGGLSNQLETQGCRLDNPMWTAALLQTDPQQIINAHLAYLEAGARIIITSSYQANFLGFGDMGLSSNESKTLILKSVELAESAITLFCEKHPNADRPLIAASIGPYGAYLADGSEYRGYYDISDPELEDFHREKIEILDNTNADWIACETIPSYRETKILSSILEDCKKKSWVTFSCKDDEHLNDGTPLKKCIEHLSTNKQIFAVGVNCTHPTFISGLIRRIKAVDQYKKIIVYPNSGELYDAGSKSWSGKPGIPIDLVKEWIEVGADIIGGCCRIGPKEIKAIGEVIANASGRC